MATLAVSFAVGLAARALISLLTPTQVQEGQRLDDLDVSKSEFGYNLAKPFGRVRYNGCNVFWAQPLRELVTESKSGGGGKGGRKSTVREYEYFGTWAVNFGYDPCTISRIWLNGQLVYNRFGIASDTTVETNILASDKIEIYEGTTTQNPSPTIESYEGVGNVPAFRRRPYIVFNDLSLTEDFNNSIPKVDVEVISDVINILTSNDPSLVTSTASLGIGVNDYGIDLLTAYVLGLSGGIPQALLDIGVDANNPLTAYRTRLSDVLRYVMNSMSLVEADDYELLLDLTMNGAVFAQNGESTHNFIEDLQRTFNFISANQNGIIRFIRPDQFDVPLVLSSADLGSREDGDSYPDKYVEKRTEETELPTAITYDYKNIGKDHQRGVAPARRYVSSHTNEITYKTAVVLNDTEALTAASRNLYQSWSQRQRIEGIKLMPQYIPYVKPGYRLQVPVRGSNIEIQVDKVTIGTNYILEVSGVVMDYSLNTNVVNKGTDNNYETQTGITDIDPARSIILDIPLLSDSDANIESGLYVGAWVAAGETWEVGSLIEAPANTNDYELATTLAGDVVHGFTDVAIPATNPFVVDETTTITVTLTQGVLESITQDTFDQSLENLMYIPLTGEIIAFRDAVLQSGTTYNISYLARGVYGTEQSILSPETTSGTKVYFLRTKHAFRRILRAVGDLGVAYDYKALFGGEDATVNPYTSTQTYQAISLRPYAPVLPEMTLDNSNNLILEWTRRTRFGGGWNETSLTVPINEQQEEYEVEILDATATTILRTVTVVGSPSYTYSNADIITDFGSVPSTLDFNVYQISDVFGRGLALEARDVPITMTES